MKWTRPADIKAQVERIWLRGDICRAAVGNGELFPFSIRLKQPSSRVMQDDLAGTQAWVKEIQTYAQKQHIQLDWQPVNHRYLGRQELPRQLVLDTPLQAARLIGQVMQLKQFMALYKQGIKRLAVLQSWLLQYPLKALELVDAWERVLDLCEWMRLHPNPRIYLRQVDVVGVDSKFIEHHRKVLAQLFDLILPVFAVDDNFSGVAGFARRYGFLDKPTMIRLRPLDGRIALLHSGANQDVMMTAKAFAALHPAVRQQVKSLFIIENEINYLAFPDYPNALVIFGSGYGFEAFRSATWMHDCAIYYWGDLDTHGFAILNQLRAMLPHTQSFLMDQQTLLAHRHAWGTEPKQETKDLKYLNTEEAAVYDDLRNNRLTNQLRLEQERIAFDSVFKAITQL
jgi:hypothetical protein